MTAAATATTAVVRKPHPESALGGPCPAHPNTDAGIETYRKGCEFRTMAARNGKSACRIASDPDAQRRSQRRGREYRSDELAWRRPRQRRNHHIDTKPRQRALRHKRGIVLHRNEYAGPADNQRGNLSAIKAPTFSAINVARQPAAVANNRELGSRLSHGGLFRGGTGVSTCLPSKWAKVS